MNFDEWRSEEPVNFVTGYGKPNALELDPYEIAMPDRRQIYREVHALALRYHWSEDEILELSRARRRLYLDLIDETAAASH